MEKSAIIPVREKEPNISSIQCPMLTSVNYTAWAMRMKVMLRVNKAWEAIDPGEADPIKNDVATAFLFQSIPENLVPQIGHLETAKDMWEAIKSRYLGADRVREARLQTLTSEFERLSMKESENIDEFAGRMSSLAAQATSLGQVIEESKMVKKFLNGLPRNKYIQLVASLEQSLDLNKTGFEDIVGRLKAYEERIGEDGEKENQNKLLYSSSYTPGTGSGSSWSRGRGRGNRGRGRGRGSYNDTNKPEQTQNSGKPKRDHSRVKCWRCDKLGHFANKCPEKNNETNLVQTEEADAALYMHETIYLHEKKIVPSKFEEEKDEQSIWYLDNGASNHMTGKRFIFRS